MESDANYLKYFEEVDKDGLPIEIDRENAKVLMKFLDTFYEVTLKFNGTSYVISSKSFIDVSEIQQELYGLVFEDDEDGLLGNMERSMKVKYDKYRRRLMILLRHC